MARKELNAWLTKFDREIGLRSSVILFGNTNDIVLNRRANGKYQPFLDVVADALRDKGYETLVKWDRVDGIDYAFSNDIPEGASCSSQPAGDEYDMGFGDGELSRSNGSRPDYKSPDEFFPYLLQTLADGAKKTAFILDYSDYIFGNANSLSEKERNYLATLGKSLQSGQSYNMLSPSFEDIGNLVVIVTHNNATIPPALYIGNPLVSTINVPLPGRSEREAFVQANKSNLLVKENLSAESGTAFDDLIDALDGYSLKEIAQIMKLSRQVGEVMSFGKLINLYKYGEKVSPWEELSHDKLETITERLGERVKGQDQAIAKVKDVIIRAYTGFSGLQHSAKQKKPKGTLFFVGPTGVGKTELAKALAEFVFGDESACIRFDMSEYNHEHSDQRLVGAPPGYVGYEAGGQLTNSIKEKPFCVLLFDEIEKAHGRILDKFLQILEDGRLTDGKGETVYFSEAIIIFTSNIGAADISADLKPAEARREFISAVRRHFVEELGRPELLNRIGDNIVAFNFIEDPEVFSKIAKGKFKSVEDFVKERYEANIKFENEREAFLAIAKKAGKQNGGRGLLNVMESAIINPLAEFIFERDGMLTNRTIEIKLEDEDHLLFDLELK